MSTAGTAPVIYPARRAVEHVASLPGVRPLRLFPVLWPLRQVEITASVHDEQAYEVIDHFLVRGIAEGQISRITDLAWFFTLPAALVRRCLDFLRTIGHLHLDGDRLLLTDLGIRSWQAGIRYEPKESRQHLLFERRSGWPLPRPYYQGDVAVLPSLDVPDERLRDRSRFLVHSADDLRQRVAPVARALQVPAPTVAELRAFATRTGRAHEAARLDALAAAALRRP